MPQALSKTIIHLIFSTKDRASFLDDAIKAQHSRHLKSNWTTLRHRNGGFKECGAIPQIPNEARDNRTLVLEYT